MNMLYGQELLQQPSPSSSVSLSRTYTPTAFFRLDARERTTFSKLLKTGVGVVKSVGAFRNVSHLAQRFHPSVLLFFRSMVGSWGR